MTRYGMDPTLGHVTYEEDRAAFLEATPVLQQRRYSEDTAREIDRAVKQAVDEAFDKAVGILKASRKTLEEGAQALLQKETLVEEDLQQLVAAPGGREVAAAA